MFAPQNPSSSDKDRVYWAAREHADVIVEAKRLTKQYFEECTRAGLTWQWRSAIAQYFGQSPNKPGDFATQALARVGPEGQYTRFRINEVRGFMRQQNALAQGQRVAFQCLTRNSDHSALASVATSNNALSYLYTSAVGDPGERRGLEFMGTGGIAYAHVAWDPSAGDDIDVMEPITDDDGKPVEIDVPAKNEDGSIMIDELGQPITAKQTAEVEVKKPSGAPSGAVYGPWDVVRDPRRAKMRWCIVRDFASKHDLAARLPDLADRILDSKDFDEWIPEVLLGWGSKDSIDEDTCLIEHIYHERCPALPNGLYLCVLDDIVLWHGGCPRKKGLPVAELCGDRLFFSALGYANPWDLLSIQEMFDQLASDAATNLSTFGRQVMVFDKGGDYDFNSIARGLVAIAKTPGTDAPQAMNYAQLPAAVQWFFGWLMERMESVSGLYATSRGKSDPNITSGRMAALYHSITYEYQNSIQAAFDTWRKDIGNIILELVRDNAPDKFLVEVAGKSEQPYLMEFRKESMMGVSRVQVETMNPMMRSQAGKFEMWDAIKDQPPERIEGVVRGLQTGDWSALYEEGSACDLRLVWENEQLQQGVPVIVGAGDNPAKHLPKHYSLVEKLLTMPESPQREGAIGAALQHIYQHMMEWQSIDPRLAIPLKIQLPPPLPGSPTAQMGMMGMMQQFGQGAPGGGQAANQQKAPGMGGGAPNGAPQGPQQQDQGGSVSPSPAATQAGVEMPEPAAPPNTARPGEGP